MTGAVTVAAVVGMLSLIAGFALGWFSRRANDWCPSCGQQLGCETCQAGTPRPEKTSAAHHQA